MFQISNQEARKLISQIGSNYSSGVSLRSICNALQRDLPRIDPLGFDFQSAYSEKWQAS